MISKDLLFFWIRNALALWAMFFVLIYFCRGRLYRAPLTPRAGNPIVFFLLLGLQGNFLFQLGSFQFKAMASDDWLQFSLSIVVIIAGFWSISAQYLRLYKRVLEIELKKESRI